MRNRLVYLKRNKVSVKFGIAFPKGVYHYSQELRSIKHPTKKGVWLTVKPQSILTLNPVETEIEIDSDADSYDIFIYQKNMYAYCAENGVIRKYKFTIPYVEIEKLHKEKILAYRGMPNTEEMYVGDVFMQGEFVEEIL